MRTTLRIIAAFGLTTALAFASGCGDDGGTCGTNTARMASSQLDLAGSGGMLMQGTATEGTLEVDRDAETVTLTYTNEAGESVVEVYRISGTNDPGAQDPPTFPGS